MDMKQAVEFAILMLVLVAIAWGLRPRRTRAREAWHNSFYGSADTTGGHGFSFGHHGCSDQDSDGGSCDGGDGGD